MQTYDIGTDRQTDMAQPIGVLFKTLVDNAPKTKLRISVTSASLLPMSGVQNILSLQSLKFSGRLLLLTPF
jgi:hypothetical protein